jgi:hypothetical protein
MVGIKPRSLHCEPAKGAGSSVGMTARDGEGVKWRNTRIYRGRLRWPGLNLE